MSHGGLALDEVLYRRMPEAVVDLGWSAHGELAAILADGSVMLSEGSVMLGTSEVCDLVALAWAPSGDRLAVVDHDGEIALWSWAGGWRPLESLPGWGTQLAWSPVNRLAVSSGSTVLLYNLDGEPSPTVLAELPSPITDLVWRGTAHVCAATLGGTWVIDTTDGDRLCITEEGVSSLSLAVAPNGAIGIGQAGGQMVVRWNAEEARHLSGFAAPLWAIGWDGLAGRCVSAVDGLVVAWRALDPVSVDQTPDVLDAHRCEIVACATSPEGALVASADVGGKVLAWDPRSEHSALCGWQSRTRVHCCAWADDGRRLAVGTDTGLWLLEVLRGDAVA